MPIFPKPIDLAANYVWTGDHTFDGVVTCNGDFNAVDGSFTGNLTSEVGGTVRHYSTGTEGDPNTSFIEIGDDGTRHTVYTNQTGAGAYKSLRIGNSLHYMEVIPTSARLDWYISGTKRFSVGSSSVQFKDNLLPISGLVPNIGSSSLRWLGVYAQHGSFTGTLTSEVGGSYKLYNLGDESANDSEYLSMGYDANKAELLSVSEGAGVNRTFRVGGYVGVAFRGVELDTASGSFKWLYNNAQQLAITSNTCTFNSSTMIAKDVRVNNIRPTVDNSYDCGLDAFRWRTTYSVDGSFSGTLKTEGFKTGVAATTQAAITLSDTDNTLLADCTSNNVVVSLPASAGNDGLQYTIKKVDGSANYCSVTPNGAETIDGQSGLTITGQYESVNLVCYSGEWYLV